MHGVSAAKRVFSRKLGISINKCTVRNFKKDYDEKISPKQASVGNCSPVKELHTNRQGRPVIMGEKLDLMVQKYILAIRERGGSIDTSVVIAAAKGIVKSVQRSQLVEHGGPAELSRMWARSLLKRMKFTKGKGTTKSKLPVAEFVTLNQQFPPKGMEPQSESYRLWNLLP